MKRQKSRHAESHRLEHLEWLRAAVLGANDGIVSTSSLVLGVVGAHASHGSILLTGIAGLVAGAMSMATGEFVSVSSQADGESAALDLERAELEEDYSSEQRELAGHLCPARPRRRTGAACRARLDGARCAGCACARRARDFPTR